MSNADRGVFATQEPNTRDADMVGLRYDPEGAFSGESDVMKFVVKTEPDASGGGFDPENENVEALPTAGSNDITNNSTNPRLYRVEWASGENAELFTNGFLANIAQRTNEDGGGLPLTGTLSESTGSNVKNILGQGPKGGGTNAYWDGKIAEVIFYGEKINEAQHRIVESYLETRYNFEPEPIKNDLYGFDDSHPGEVGGIGRTSGGETHLKGGSSIIQLDDRDESSLSNGDFALLGHDGRALTYTTNERPNGDTRTDGGSNAQKTRREWKVDLTGASSQTVSVDVELSKLSFPAGFNDFAVFVDDDGDFSNGATFYDLDDSGEAGGVTIEDGQYLTVATIKRTIAYTNGTASDFEDAGGGAVGDAFAPALDVELSYPNSAPISGVPYTVSEVTGTLVQDTDNTFGNEGPGNQEDYRGADGTFTIPADTETDNINAGGGALEILNDTRDAANKSDEQSSEVLDVALDTGSLPAALAAGGTTTFSFTINDDDDPRKVSFATGNLKPIAIQGSNPQEDTDTNADNQSDNENDVSTVSFEVALPEGITGSVSTKAVFEVNGAAVNDFSIPANGDNEKVSDRKGKVVISTTKSVDGPDPDSDPSSTGYGTFDIAIDNDALHENDETITVTLLSAESASLDSRDGADLDFDYAILNDDPVPSVQFTSSSDSDQENVTGAVGTLQLDAAAGKDLDVAFSVGGSATGGGTDYTQNTTSPVTFPAGTTERDVSFSVVNDNVQEINETIEVSISSGSTEPSVGSPDTFTYTILDDDNVGPDGPGGVGDSDALQVWMRANGETNQSPGGSPATGGDQVGEWVDESGNGNDFTQSGSARPVLQTNAINGRPALQFDETNNEVLTDPDGNDNYVNGEPAFSFLTVSASNEISTESGVFVADNGDGTGGGTDQNDIISVRYDIDGGTEHLELGVSTNESGGTDVTFNSNDGTLSTNPQLLQYEWASGSILRFFVNGTNEGSASPPSGGLSGAESVAVGRTDGPEPYWDGLIAETILYSGQTLNQAQRRIVGNYLSAKYDIPYANDIYAGDTGFGQANGNDGDPSTGGDYDLAAIGVGRAGGEVHPRARLDGLELQAKSGLDDGDFVMAGHRIPNNSVTTDLNGFTPDADDRRSQRAWAVDWTDAGAGLTVDLTFDLSRLGFQGLAGDASNYKLIVSSQDSTGAQNYSWSATSATANVSGSKITFSDVTLTSGHYYTLATTNNSASPLTNETALVVSGSAGNEGNANTSTYGGDAGWRLLGVPVEGAQANDIFSGTDDPFVEFLLDPPMMVTWDDDISNTPADGNYARVGSGTALPSGRGFALFFFDDTGTSDADPIDPDLVLDVPDTKSVPGDVDVTVGDGTPSSDDALNKDAEYHLLSNPYSVPYDLTSLLNGVSGIQSTVQIWDGNRSSGGTYEPVVVNSTAGQTEMALSGDVVAPWQGFFVQRSTVGSGPASLTFDNAGRTSGSRSIIGSKLQQKDREKPTQVTLKLVTRNGQDSLLTRDRAASLYFDTDASAEWDTYDASKLFPLTAPGDPWATIAPLGTGNDGSTEPKAVESRSKSAGSFEVPLELRASDGLEGTMTITAPFWRNVPEDVSLELVDTKGTTDTGDDEVHELTPGGDGYSFSYSASTSPSSKARQAAEDGERSPPALRPSGAAMQQPRTMEVTEKRNGAAETDEATAKDTDLSTRFALRVESGGALPVEFAGIDAAVDDRDVALSWSTASETNNTGFYVEHREADSERDFESLGFVEGAGTTDAPQNYRYRVNGLDVGEHTFRIRQVDTDGSAGYSTPVTVNVRLNEAFALSKPYPNPFRQTTTLDLTVREKQEVTAEVYDALGRRVQMLHDGMMPAGKTTRLQFRGEDMSSGLYLIRVQGETFSVTRRATLVQ
ncbi:MAG: T9SS type A sorting domain-containing protein [Salinivenus sp.]